MVPTKILFFFTNAYPYGWAEHYIENEIPFLSSAFKKVYIFPLDTTDGVKRSVPNNVEVVDIHDNVDFSKKSLILSALADLRILALDSNEDRLFRSFKNLFNARCYAKAIKDFINDQGLNSDSIVAYSYWFYQWSLIVALLRQNRIVSRSVSRAHFADVYAEVNKTPFIRFKLKQLDHVVIISNHGYNYWKNKYSKYIEKVSLGYLGVSQFPLENFEKQKENNDFKIIVSCSTIRPRKRVQLIARSLAHLDQKIHWVHFGTGPSDKREEVLEITEAFPSNITFDHKGWMKNAEIISFYRSNPVDLFVNLSTHEGVPVSIMEATSFGIPVLATDVFGIAEALEPQHCKLIDVNVGSKEVSKLMEKMLKSDASTKKDIKEFSEARFNAATNYPDFIYRYLV